MASYTAKLAGVSALVALACAPKLAGVSAVLFAGRGTCAGVSAIEFAARGRAVGVSKICDARSAKLGGTSSLPGHAVVCTLAGQSAVELAARVRLAGVSALLAARGVKIAGVSRIADDSLSRYELYRGVGAEPDLSAAPWQTFTSSPFESPALTPGQTYTFVLRERNAYNLVSQNVRSWRVTLAGGGAAVNTSPLPVQQYTLSAEPGGVVRLIGKYAGYRDAGRRALSLRIYWRTNGTDPDPATDTPLSVPLKSDDSRAAYVFTGLTAGVTLKVIVRTYRASDGAHSASSPVLSAVVLA